MVAPVALSADALLDTCGCDGTRLADLHRRLTETLLAHAQLILSDDCAQQRLIDNIRQLGRFSPSAAKYWESLLQHGRVARSDSDGLKPLEQIDDLDQLASDWTDVISLALMEPIRAHLVGLPEADASWTDPGSGLEIARHDASDATATLGHLCALDRERLIRAGTNREMVWRTRFAPLARMSNHIHLLDAFIGLGLDRHYRSRDIGRRPHPSVLEWLLTQIASARPRATVSIYTQTPSHFDETLIPQAFRRLVSDAAQQHFPRLTLNLFLLDESKWVPHDRHFRADQSGLELSAGFDRFGPTTVGSNFTITYMYGSDVQKLKDEENSVRNALGRPPLVLRDG